MQPEHDQAAHAAVVISRVTGGGLDRTGIGWAAVVLVGYSAGAHASRREGPIALALLIASMTIVYASVLGQSGTAPTVAAGESLLAPTVTRRLIEHFVSSRATREQPPDGIDELTPRALEVFKLVARGPSNSEIASELVVSEATVKTHVARILLKLGLRDRVQVVVAAYESGLVRAGAEH